MHKILKNLKWILIREMNMWCNWVSRTSSKSRHRHSSILYGVEFRTRLSEGRVKKDICMVHLFRYFLHLGDAGAFARRHLNARAFSSSFANGNCYLLSHVWAYLSRDWGELYATLWKFMAWAEVTGAHAEEYKLPRWSFVCWGRMRQKLIGWRGQQWCVNNLVRVSHN